MARFFRKRKHAKGSNKNEEKVQRAEEALRWLTVHGQGGLIKGEVSVTFGRGDRRVEALVALFKQKRFAGLEYDRRETVHASTLSAWVRQQVDAGKTVPTDLLGVYRVIKAVIVPPKVKKPEGGPPGKNSLE